MKLKMLFGMQESREYKYQIFKYYHQGKLNALFHFISVVIQLYFIQKFFTNDLTIFNSTSYLSAIILAPYIFDAIGHIFDGNLDEILDSNSVNKSLNIVNVDPFTNAYFKVRNFIEVWII